MDSQQIVSIVVAALITGCVTISMVALAWASRRGGDRRPAPSTDALEQRLARMEQSIDSIAVEMERLGEAHRFTAKLLAERQAARPPARVITPH